MFMSSVYNGCCSLQSSKQLVVKNIVNLLYINNYFGMPRKKNLAFTCIESERR